MIDIELTAREHILEDELGRSLPKKGYNDAMRIKHDSPPKLSALSITFDVQSYCKFSFPPF
jgi:hypothetical protein